jgi:hypothetical protein
MEIMQQALLSQEQEILELKDKFGAIQNTKTNMKEEIHKLSHSLNEKQELENKSSTIIQSLKKENA